MTNDEDENLDIELAEVLGSHLKDFISWTRQPRGNIVGYPAFETAQDWSDWYERGAFIRQVACRHFETLAAQRLDRWDAEKNAGKG